MVDLILGEKGPVGCRNFKVAGAVLLKVLATAEEEARVVDGVVDEGGLVPGDVHLGKIRIKQGIRKTSNPICSGALVE